MYADSAETNGEVPKYSQTLLAFELVGADFKPVKDSDFAGKRLVLSIFRSIATEACSFSVREFNERAAYVEDMISNGPAFARERFCSVESCDGDGLSLHVCDDYGMTIPTPPANGLPASGVVVTDPGHKVIYAELECWPDDDALYSPRGSLVSMDIYGFGAGPYKANTYIIANGARAFVVDPGLHARQRVLDCAAEHSLTLEAIVFTHGHVDHSREAGDLAAELDIPVYIHPDDEFFLDKAKGMSEQSRQLFDAENMVPIKDLRYLSGSTLELADAPFTLRHAPGHSPGCVLIIGEDFALTGDVLFRGSIGRTDLYGSDPAAMQASLRGPVWELDDKLAILPGHGPTSTMRAERATNPFLIQIGEVM